MFRPKSELSSVIFCLYIVRRIQPFILRALGELAAGKLGAGQLAADNWQRGQLAARSIGSEVNWQRGQLAARSNSSG